MRKSFCFFAVSLIFLSGCAKKELTTTITDSIKQDIAVIEHQIVDVAKDCKTESASAKLENIRAQVKTISLKAQNIDSACALREDVLKQENSKLKIIIGFLVLIFGGLVFLKIRKII